MKIEMKSIVFFLLGILMVRILCTCTNGVGEGNLTKSIYMCIWQAPPSKDIRKKIYLMVNLFFFLAKSFWRCSLIWSILCRQRNFFLFGTIPTTSILYCDMKQNWISASDTTGNYGKLKFKLHFHNVWHAIYYFLLIFFFEVVSLNMKNSPFLRYVIFY